MHPRSRIRGREPPPPPPPSGGRYRRRSPSPPRHHHHRRGRDPPPPVPPLRRSPDRPRRQELEFLPPPDPERRLRADILLEAGRLAAHYLVAQGVLPEHLLQAREEPSPKHNLACSRPDPPPAAAAGYLRKQRDDPYHDDDPRWRRNGGGADKGDDDRLSRRSGWDRRCHSFDGRRKYNDGAATGGGGGGGRRSHEYDDQRRPAMSRSYSQNDRRASSDYRVDRRRRSGSRSRSRSRSRTRTRSSNYGSRRDSDWRASGGDSERSSKVPEPAIVRSVVVVETNDKADDATEDAAVTEEAEMEESEIYEDEEGEYAVASSDDADDADAAEEIPQHQPSSSNVDAVHPSESVEEPVHKQPHLSDVEGFMEVATTHSEVTLIEPVTWNDGCSEVRDEVEVTGNDAYSQVRDEVEVSENNVYSEVRDELEAPQGEVEADVGDVTKDEQELPAWYGIFDLNVVESHKSCEMSEISSDPPADNVCDLVPGLVGQMSPRANFVSSETQGQDEHLVDNHQLVDGQALLNQSIGTHDMNKCDLDNEQRLQIDDDHAQVNDQLENEQMHLNHGMAVHDLDNCHLNNKEMLLKQDADEHEDHNHQNQMETEQMLPSQMNGEQLLISHGADEHPGYDHPIKNEQMLLNHVIGVHNLDSYVLNSEHMLLNNDEDKQADDSVQLQDEQMLLDRAADEQAIPHNQGIGRMIPVINLEDDYEEQSDTKEFLKSKSDSLPSLIDNVLPEHMCPQDQKTSSIDHHPRTNIPAAASSPVALNFRNMWSGRGAVNAQGIPSDDDVLYVGFDKIPIEVIDVWELPSSELGKSL